jgi:hypothetical protein
MPIRENMENVQGIIRVRFLLGLSIFIIPAFICFFAAILPKTNLSYTQFLNIKIADNEETLLKNSNDIKSISRNDNSIGVQCGNTDPFIVFALPEPLNIPQGIAMPELKLTYSNNQNGPLQIFYDYGNGFSEENSVFININDSAENTVIQTQITGWKFENQLNRIRLDPPNDSNFSIMSIEIVKPQSAATSAP